MEFSFFPGFSGSILKVYSQRLCPGLPESFFEGRGVLLGSVQEVCS
jgi:hypothetical protein